VRGGITLRHGTGPFGRDPFRATSLEGGAKRYRPLVVAKELEDGIPYLGFSEGRWGVEDHPRALAREAVPAVGL
jgi:hypothetical protein